MRKPNGGRGAGRLLGVFVLTAALGLAGPGLVPADGSPGPAPTEPAEPAEAPALLSWSAPAWLQPALGWLAALTGAPGTELTRFSGATTIGAGDGGDEEEPPGDEPAPAPGEQAGMMIDPDG